MGLDSSSSSILSLLLAFHLCAICTGDFGTLIATCPDGRFGYKCRFRCHCADDAPCDRTTGRCLTGCARGFWGPGCQLSYTCYYNGQKRLYMGSMHTTENGYTCQMWSKTTPHNHEYQPHDFPDKYYPHNYCRIMEDEARPWCYTTDAGRRWDYCNVNNCDCPNGRFGQNCIKECHCPVRNGGHTLESCDSILGMCHSTKTCAAGWRDVGCQTVSHCERNHYGWDCAKRCHCKDANDCDRFTGPRGSCLCEKGYFDPPQCKPVTKPIILSFTNKKVNPGQPSILNCTVTAVPMPLSRDIRVKAKSGDYLTLIQSNVPVYRISFTLITIFKLNALFQDNQYTCAVDGVYGSTRRTIVATTYRVPKLKFPPYATSIWSTNITLGWNPWDNRRGDRGDPPIKSYSVWYKRSVESSFNFAGTLMHSECTDSCQLSIVNLQPFTNYTFHVITRRQGKGGDGLPGPAVHVRTLCGSPTRSVNITRYTSLLVSNYTDVTATFSLSWEDPPKDSLRCRKVTHYFIYLQSDLSGANIKIFKRHATNLKSFVIGGLQPFTHYCVQMKLLTDAKLSSPFSKRHCLRTPETIPRPPSNVEITKIHNRSAVVSWKKPNPAHGNITSYKLIYWDWTGGEIELLVKSSAHRTQVLLSNLRPYKEYHLQVRAISGAGVGKPAKSIKFRTKEGLPGAVFWIRNTTRTGTSISLEWDGPKRDKGRIKYYHISCVPVIAMSNNAEKNWQAVSERVKPNVKSYTIVGLHPAVQYSCSVNASTASGYGPRKSVLAWTRALEPTIPDNPVVLSTSDHTVTVDLRPSPDRLVSFYRILVEELKQSRPKREVDESQLRKVPDFYTAKESGSKLYVAAQLIEDKASGPFTVGDNMSYGGYYNAPLIKGFSYTVWFGAFSYVDGHCSMSFTKTQSFVTAKMVVNEKTSVSGPMAVIIGVIGAFLALLIIFIIAILIRRRRVVREEAEKENLSTFIGVPQPTFLCENGSVSFSSRELIDNAELQPLFHKANSKIILEPVYGNLQPMVQPVKVEDLWDYVREQKADDFAGLTAEFCLLPSGLTAKCDIAKRLPNKNKNRYGNIIAYDHSRVPLTPLENDPYSDYINANYIDGYKKQSAYIAAQGPTKATLHDFWRMIWQENSKTIIMLTNPTETGRKKCDHYWPEEGCETYSGITVQMTTCDVLPDYTIRTFLLTKGDESKLVKQFHYTTWPDHGVPKFGSSLILFRQKIRAYDQLTNGPPIVHCSAGVGRTGTYIAVDTQLEKARLEGLVDVHNCVQLMRTQRVNMVQTLEQYTFVYDVLLEALISGETTSSLLNFSEIYRQLCLPQPVIGKCKLEEQFEILCLISSTLFKSESSAALDIDNVHKNRFKHIVPANRCRVYLTAASEQDSNYINAVYSHSYLKRNSFILCQIPLPHTVKDFWQLVYDHSSSTIVLLNEISALDDSCSTYWPIVQNVCSVGTFQVEILREMQLSSAILLREFLLTNNEKPEESPQVIRQFNFTDWIPGSDIPASSVEFREMMQQITEWQGESGSLSAPVVIHCLDGCTRSGILNAAFTLLERIQSDLEVDIFQTVKSIRINRPQAIPTLEQYEFLHDLALDFMSSADHDSSTFIY